MLEKRLPLQEQWNALLATALLGTEQRKCTVVSPEVQFLSSLSSVDPEKDHEEWVLLASAYASAYRRAGQMPSEVRSAQLLPPAPAESGQICSAPVAARLADLLNEANILEPFLDEALTLLAAKKRLVPPGLLPDLFNWARRNKERRALLPPIVGERGQWLAALNSEWKNVLQVDGTEIADKPPVSGQQALYAALKIEDNIFSKTFSVFKGQGLGGHERMIHLVMEKVLAESKPGRTYYNDHGLVTIAIAAPPAILPELINRIFAALKAGEYTWLARLLELLEYRQQMLEEIANE
jgi:hypothetical protein